MEYLCCCFHTQLCFVGNHTHSLQRDQSSQSQWKSTLNTHLKDWWWSWNPDTLATWCWETTLWKRSWCWERLTAGGKGGSRGWDGWLASLTQWSWLWAKSRRQWRAKEPGMPQSMGSQRVGLDLATEQQPQYSYTEITKMFRLPLVYLQPQRLSLAPLPPDSHSQNYKQKVSTWKSTSVGFRSLKCKLIHKWKESQ